MAADAHTFRGSRRFLIICWGGVVSGGIVVGLWLASDEVGINQNVWLMGTIVALAVYYGIVGLTLWWQIIKAWRWWCLLVLVPWIWPPLGALVLALIPVAFLWWVTARIVHLDRLHGPAV
jgi:hypothetical protein